MTLFIDNCGRGPESFMWKIWEGLLSVLIGLTAIGIVGSVFFAVASTARLSQPSAEFAALALASIGSLSILAAIGVVAEGSLVRRLTGAGLFGGLAGVSWFFCWMCLNGHPMLSSLGC